jgi:hypothetical protein
MSKHHHKTPAVPGTLRLCSVSAELHQALPAIFRQIKYKLSANAIALSQLMLQNTSDFGRAWFQRRGPLAIIRVAGECGSRSGQLKTVRT